MARRGNKHNGHQASDPTSNEDPTPACPGRRQGGELACLHAALDYLGRGWSALAVCPPNHADVGDSHARRCGSPGKAPWGPWKKFQDEWATRGELRRKWEDNPQLNVGIALGPVSGRVGVDVDGPEGEAKLAELSGDDLPDTLEFSSGRPEGGRRLLYAIPDGMALRTTHQHGEHHGGVSLLAKGSQIVMPPSQHATGTCYAWITGHGPDDLAPAPAPPWLVGLLSRTGAAKGRGTPPKPCGNKLRKGARNTTLTSLAGSLRRRGLGEDAIRAALRAENEARCHPPLGGDEVDRIAASIAKYPPGGNGGIDPVPYFEAGGAFHLGKTTRYGPVAVALCNFTARIAEEVVHDDGVEQMRRLALEGALADGTPLPRCEVPAGEFAGMGWVVPAWGRAPSSTSAREQRTICVAPCSFAPETCRGGRSSPTPAGASWAASGTTCTPGAPSGRTGRREASRCPCLTPWPASCCRTAPPAEALTTSERAGWCPAQPGPPAPGANDERARHSCSMLETVLMPGHVRKPAQHLHLGSGLVPPSRSCLRRWAGQARPLRVGVLWYR
jgi:hypothetical protein